MYNICIVGGGGFIGTAIRKSLKELGYSVFIIGRRRSIDLKDNEIYYSIQDWKFDQLVNQLSGISFLAIIDCSYTTVPGTSFDDPIKDFSDNLSNIHFYLEFGKKLKIKKYIYLSSGGTVYGDASDKAIDESAATNPVSPYGVTKLACEKYAYLFHKLYDMPVLIVRPSNVYGPGQLPHKGQGIIPTVLSCISNSSPVIIFGDGENVRDYIYISDFVNAILDVLDYGVIGETYNIGSGNGVSINELILGINAVVAKDGYKVITQHNDKRGFDVRHNVLDTSKLIKLNNWRSEISLNNGLSNTWNWIKTLTLDH
jgi:UDP-glucose 4-epimerase